MATMPKTESDIVTLAEAMIAGLTAHPDDFPSITAAPLQSMLTDFKHDKASQLDAQSQTIAATESKNTSLEVLATTMRDMLKRAEADTTPDPTKLYEIGWGPRQTPQPYVPEVPGQVADLHPIAEGNGMICLQWSAPANGGPVANYLIERQQQPDGAQPGPWVIAGNAYDTSCRLTEQPVNIRVGYRVRAVNASGEGQASSVVSVVLPQVN